MNIRYAVLSERGETCPWQPLLIFTEPRGVDAFYTCSTLERAHLRVRTRFNFNGSPCKIIRIIPDPPDS